MHQLPHIFTIADNDVSVESHFLAHAFLVLHSGVIRRYNVHNIAGSEVKREVHEERDSDQDRNQHDQSLDDISKHYWGVPPLCNFN